jgi:ABC-type nitrate/sulfonate/bicarbonate transport system substrate-binding protein
MRARSLVAILVCLQWVLGATTVSFAASAPGTVEIKAGGFGGDAVSSWPVYIAQDRGFFAKEGLQTSFTRSYEQMMALIGGNFEVIGEAADAPILAAEKGADIVVVYDLSRRPSQFMVLAPGVQSIADLDGKIFGVWKIPSTDQLLTKKFLARQGIDAAKVSFRRIGGSRERYAALQNRQIAATVLSTGFAYKAQEEGMRIVAVPADWEVFPWTFVIFRKSWAEANSGTVVKYIRALHRGAQWLYDPANFEQALRTLKPVSGFDDKTMRWALKDSVDSRIYNLEKPSVPIFQLAADWLLSEGFLTKPFDTSRILNTKFYEQAIQ